MARKKVILRQLQRVQVGNIAADSPETARHQPSAVESMARTLDDRGNSPPLLVMEPDGKSRHSLVVGSLRLAAARHLGWHEIDCIVVDQESETQLEVVKRLQRNDFDPWELADTLDYLKRKYGWTQEQVGMAIGKTRDYVANILAITQVAPEVRHFILNEVHSGDLTARHLRYVARSPRSEQMRVAERILEQTLSTKELEREKQLTSLRSSDYRFIKVREMRRPGAINFPRLPKEWRRYLRQLNTDLRRIDRQEVMEHRRAEIQMMDAKHRIKMARSEANKKRRELNRELRVVKKQLLRMGE